MICNIIIQFIKDLRDIVLKSLVIFIAVAVFQYIQFRLRRQIEQFRQQRFHIFILLQLLQDLRHNILYIVFVQIELQSRTCLRYTSYSYRPPHPHFDIVDIVKEHI